MVTLPDSAVLQLGPQQITTDHKKDEAKRRRRKKTKKKALASHVKLAAG